MFAGTARPGVTTLLGPFNAVSHVEVPLRWPKAIV
jgi:hypothetical protein